MHLILAILATLIMAPQGQAGPRSLHDVLVSADGVCTVFRTIKLVLFFKKKQLFEYLVIAHI